MADIEHFTCYWHQMMIEIVNSSEIPSICYDFYQFALYFDGNHTEVQWNSLLCHGMSMARGVNENQWLTVTYIDPHHPRYKRIIPEFPMGFRTEFNRPYAFMDIDEPGRPQSRPQQVVKQSTRALIAWTTGVNRGWYGTRM